MPIHPSHQTRGSDASTFDVICERCGATDQVPGGFGALAEPCPGDPPVIDLAKYAPLISVEPVVPVERFPLPEFTCGKCGKTEKGSWNGNPDCGTPGCLTAHATKVIPEGWGIYDPGPEVDGWAYLCAECPRR